MEQKGCCSKQQIVELSAYMKKEREKKRKSKETQKKSHSNNCTLECSTTKRINQTKNEQMARSNETQG